MQAETRSIWAMRFGAPYISDFTVPKILTKNTPLFLHESWIPLTKSRNFVECSHTRMSFRICITRQRVKLALLSNFLLKKICFLIGQWCSKLSCYTKIYRSGKSGYNFEKFNFKLCLTYWYLQIRDLLMMPPGDLEWNWMMSQYWLR